MNSHDQATWRSIGRMLTGMGIAAGLLFLLLAFVPFEAVRNRLDAIAGDGSADPYTRSVHLRLQLFSGAIALSLLMMTCVFIALSARITVWVKSLAKRLFRELGEWKSAGQRLIGEMFIELVLLTCLAAGLRLCWLHQPMRFDEAYTWLQYASWPWYIGLSRYEDPNNHVFHTLCVHFVTRFLGSDPWIIRLPALTAGVLMVPAAMLWCRQLDSRRSAFLTGVYLACSSPLLEYSTNARGYTLVGLLTCCLGLLAWRLWHQRELLSWIAFVVLSALGCWTIPVMVYPIFVVAVWWFAASLHPVTRRPTRPSFKWEAVIALAASAFLTVLLYLPILVTRGAGAVTGNSFIRKLSWSDAAQQLPYSYLESAALLFRDQNPLSLLLLVLGVLASCAMGDIRRRSLRQCMLISLVALSLVPLIQRVVPFPRIWLFLIPWITILAMIGIQQILFQFGGRRQQGLVAIVLAISCLWPVSRTISEQTIERSLETGAAPDADQVAAMLPGLLRSREPVIAIVPVSAPLTYYCRQTGLPDEHLNPYYWRQEKITSAVVVVSRLDSHTVEESLEVFQLAETLDPATSELLIEFPTCLVYRVTNSP